MIEDDLVYSSPTSSQFPQLESLPLAVLVMTQIITKPKDRRIAAKSDNNAVDVSSMLQGLKIGASIFLIHLQSFFSPQSLAFSTSILLFTASGKILEQISCSTSR